LVWSAAKNRRFCFFVFQQESSSNNSIRYAWRTRNKTEKQKRRSIAALQTKTKPRNKSGEASPHSKPKQTQKQKRRSIAALQTEKQPSGHQGELIK
jgi:hypothetical protein